MKKPAAPPPGVPALAVPTRTKVLFSAGDLTTSLPLTIIAFFQFYFLSDIAGLGPGVAGWVVAVAKAWDAVNDPLYGVLADRIRLRWGRRRGPMVLAVLPLGLAFMLMWIVPPLAGAGLVAYYVVVLLLFDSFFTVYHVSYNSLTPLLARDYDERSALNGVRMVYQLAGALGSVVLLTVAGWYVTDPRVLYTAAGVALGAVSMVPPLLAFRVTRRVDTPGSETALAPLRALRATVRSRPFRLAAGTYLLSWTATSIMSTVLVLFARYYMRVPGHANYLVLAAEASALACIPLVVLAARTLDKKRAFIAGSAAWLLVLLGLSALPPGWLAAAYVLAVASGVGIATAYVVPWSMIPDIVEHDQLMTGERREASFYAFASFFQKLGTGFAIWLVGQVLARMGYVTPPAGAEASVITEQPPAAVVAIRVFMGPVPAVLLAAAIAVCAFYPIGREAHRRMREELESKAGRERGVTASG